MASKVPGPGAKKPAKVAAPAPVAAVPLATPEPAPIVERVVEPAKAAAERVVETVKHAASSVVEKIKEAAPQAEQTAAQGKDIMETTIEKTQAIFAEFNEKAKAQAEKGTKLVAEATEFAKGNVEALVESGKIAAKGFESLGQDAADYSRRSFEHATAALKSMSAVKSPADFFKLQSDYVRASFDSIVAETSKNTEAMLKLAGDAAQPLSSRFALAADKVKAAA